MYNVKNDRKKKLCEKINVGKKYVGSFYRS